MCVVYSSIAGAYKMSCACMCIAFSRISITNVYNMHSTGPAQWMKM